MARYNDAATVHGGGKMALKETHKSLLAEFRTASASTILGVATALALLGFLLVHRYAPDVGIVWNIMNGKILLQPECPLPDASTNFVPVITANCGANVPYRWILGIIVSVVALWALLRVRKSS